MIKNNPQNQQHVCVSRNMQTLMCRMQKRYFIAKSENILHTYSVTLKILSTLFLYITTMDLAQDQLIDILIRLIDLTLFI